MDLYHVLNRGVDKRDVVLDDHDRLRFLHDLYAFNDQQNTLNYKLPSRRDDNGKKKPRKPLVHIHAFCLMKNHYHLLLSEACDRGIPNFMKKLNMGYAKYFNEKNGRSGALWQGKYKKRKIERNAHFLYIPYYIHLNPLDFIMPEWRAWKIRNISKALEYLRTYRWSSHLDYLGIKNFPSITEREMVANIIGTREKYERQIRDLTADSAFEAQGDSLE